MLPRMVDDPFTTLRMPTLSGDVEAKRLVAGLCAVATKYTLSLPVAFKWYHERLRWSSRLSASMSLMGAEQ